MQRRFIVALSAAVSAIGAVGTAAGLPITSPLGVTSQADAPPAAEADLSAGGWFGYEGVTASGLPAGPGGDRLAVLPAPGQASGVAGLLDELGVASIRTVGEVLDVTAPPAVTAVLAGSPLVASVEPVQRAYETAAAGQASDADALSSSGVTAWQAAGYDGHGATLAVIDTGFAGWDEAQQAGLVPATVTGDDIDHCDAGFSARPHGTTTASVIHDAAPAARLVRVCIDDAMDLAAAVTALIERGDIDIVNMALGFYNTGPGDGTGGVGSPDDSARRAQAAGLVWVNSAGNEAPLHYGGAFADADGDSFGEYAGSDDEHGRFTVPAGADVEVFLRWNEWTTSPPPDAFRLCFSISDGGPLNCLDAAQPLRSTPVTGVALTNGRNEPVTFYVAIKRVNGSGSPDLDLFLTEASDWEHPVAASSLVDPAAVPGVVAVGAACTETGTVQPVSSQGPTLDGRPGISLVASGAGPTSSGGGCADGLGGTSAAAPHVSAALALLLQSDPSARGTHLVEQLLSRARAASDPGAPGVDPVYGHGLLSLGSPPPFGPAAGSSELSFVVAHSSDRRGAVALAEQTLSGRPFIWLAPLFPDPPPTRVEFFIDDRLVNVEVWPTLDVAGGFPEQSFPVDTTRLSDGRHRLTAAITWADGRRELASASLVVDNTGTNPPPPPGVITSLGAPLNGRSVSADALLELTVDPSTTQPIDHVRFFVDAVEIVQERLAPYSMVLPAVGDLAPGQHMVRAIAINTDGTLWAVDANFSV